MNAFREFSEIVSLLQPVAGAHTAIAHFLAEPNADRLRELFAGLLNMQGEEKSRALAVLKATVASQQGEPWDTIRFIAQFYPDDSGLFSPLLLNVVKLNPGEAMFLFAETPHAYLQGVALEVMANSDNVLRAGLTPKYIDIPELVANVKFVAKPAAQLLTQPEKDGAALEFPIPVEDFAFSLHDLQSQSQPQRLAQESAAILFCVEGEAVLSKGDERLTLKPGESAFVAANESPVNVSGVGRLARVYNKLN
ncbi:Mannose-6-phosphate isomerase [Cronobacter turicensis 564]|nr:Mannose-6-phosphate isomerase [Cronobacter turicensis 564]